MPAVARIEGSLVVDVIVVDNAEAGCDWAVGSIGGEWVNADVGPRQAGIGMVYDIQRQAFYMPQPTDGNPLWFFNEETVQWELPKPPIEEIQLDPNWTPPIGVTP